jgi:hypothetical protein
MAVVSPRDYKISGGTGWPPTLFLPPPLTNLVRNIIFRKFP